jgi:hypothetical protein
MAQPAMTEPITPVFPIVRESIPSLDSKGVFEPGCVADEGANRTLFPIRKRQRFASGNFRTAILDARMVNR